MLNRVYIILVLTGVFVSTINGKPPKGKSTQKESGESSTGKTARSPIISHRFIGGDGFEYRIGDLPKTKYGEALKMMTKYIPRDDPIMLAFGLSFSFNNSSPNTFT